MSLNDFYVMSLRELERFEEYWKEQRAKDQAKFPAEMEPGDWDEQFRLFIWGDDA